jgi:transposase
MLRESMRGDDQQQSHIFSYLSPEQRVRKDHPLRAVRAMVEEVLKQMSRRFDAMYAKVGRPSIPPEQLLRAQLLQMLYSIRSERLLMEEIDYSVLFRWFIGLNLDDEVWDATVFTKNRDRLLDGDVAKEFLACVVEKARAQGWASDEHFTVDGTLLEAWAGAKSFQPKDKKQPPPDDPGNPTVNFHGEKRSNQTHESKTDAEALLARKGWGKESKLSYCGNLLVENQRIDRRRRSVSGQWHRRARCGADHAGETSWNARDNGGRRQRVRHAGLRERVPEPAGNASCGAKPQTPWRQRN